MRRLRVFLVTLCACAEPTQPEGTCLQTSEFGNYGCAIVRGVVRDGTGQLLAGAHVSLAQAADGDDFAHTAGTTGADGAFSVRLIRFSPAAPTASDSATLWIRATLIGATTTRHDSTLVRLRVAAVGTFPDTAVVSIQIP